MSSSEKYGWYSKKQHIRLTEMVKNKSAYVVINDNKQEIVENKNNCVIYKNENGECIVCTEITSAPNRPSSNFDDYVSRGKVIKFVKQCYINVE